MADLRSDSRRELRTAGANVDFHALDALSGARLDVLPHTVKILLENLLRRSGGRDVSDEDVSALASWPAEAPAPAWPSCRRAC